MAEKGLISKKMADEAGQWLDEKIKLPAILETIDGMAFKLVINQLDDNFGEKVPEPYKAQISGILADLFEEKDREAALLKLGELVDSLIDIPGIDDITEKAIFSGLMQIAGAVLANVGLLN